MVMRLTIDPTLIIRSVLDFALPPRCASCGTIVEQVHTFCPDCWKAISFLGQGGCISCGLPLHATDQDLCASCLARPPRLYRQRAAVEYGDTTRGLVMRLKYGRKVAVAKTMARYMAPLLQDSGPGPILVPVPLHRGRLWARGFNQSLLLAVELARITGHACNSRLLIRTRRTPRLQGMTRYQRRRAVAGAFRVLPGADLAGKSIILVDDVLTTGSTANACARVLYRAGAGRVDLVSWARVVRPAVLDS